MVDRVLYVLHVATVSETVTKYELTVAEVAQMRVSGYTSFTIFFTLWVTG